MLRNALRAGTLAKATRDDIAALVAPVIEQYLH
jgi:hypothetical protein